LDDQVQDAKQEFNNFSNTSENSKLEDNTFDIDEELNNLLLSREQDDIESVKLSSLNPESFDKHKFNEIFDRIKQKKENSQNNDFPSAFNEIDGFTNLNDLNQKLLEYDDIILNQTPEKKQYLTQEEIDFETYLKQRENENKELLEKPKFQNSVNYYKFLEM
jgi:hypothetical protein